MTPTFFATPEEFRAWLEEHHETAQELLVGLYKKGSSRPGMTLPEAVEEALCFGWIDGIGRRIDDVSYSVRFTPRKPRGTWSAVNIERVQTLIEQGRMRPTGLAAFERRTVDRMGVYSHEQQAVASLDEAAEQQFRANGDAWTYFQSQPPSYRKAAIWWVVSAKKEETRHKRLATLIDDSAHRRTVKPLTRPTKAN
ncbi:MAG: YdeI/OmpD-associated family protein [Thermomicrobiales bacterium]